MSNRYSNFGEIKAAIELSTLQLKSKEPNKEPKNVFRTNEKQKPTLLEKVEPKEAEPAEKLSGKRLKKEPLNLSPVGGDYSSPEGHPLQSYSLRQDDFEESLYLQHGHNSDLEEFYQKKEFPQTAKETLDNSEAQETVQKVIYQASAHINDLDFNTKRKFQVWQQLNKTLLFLYAKHSFIQTSDVNYNLSC